MNKAIIIILILAAIYFVVKMNKKELPKTTAKDN